MALTQRAGWYGPGALGHPVSCCGAAGGFSTPFAARETPGLEIIKWMDMQMLTFVFSKAAFCTFIFYCFIDKSTVYYT